jgi:hypothetical protein
MKNDNENESNTCHEPLCLLEKHLARSRVKKNGVIKIMVDDG